MSLTLYLVAQESAYSLEISKAFKISNTQVLRTLNKLEQADILVGQSQGRTRVYRFNTRWYLFKELEALLKKALTQMPLDLQAEVFAKRIKPRKKGKPI